jgi:predicted adenylyl cyclase CyaB
LGAEDRGVLVQRDTYFEVPRGRLKLREELDGTPHLISYTRPDEPAGRESHYRIVKVPQAEELIAALSATLGIRVVVSKRRRLFIWQSVRIHLDEVEGLGSFVEFEAVATPGSDLSVEIKRVEYLRDRFELEDADLIGTGYADLLLASR